MSKNSGLLLQPLSSATAVAKQCPVGFCCVVSAPCSASACLSLFKYREQCPSNFRSSRSISEQFNFATRLRHHNLTTRWEHRYTRVHYITRVVVKIAARLCVDLSVR
jgi:hypothetical protein